MVTHLRAQRFLRTAFVLKLVCQLKGGKDHVRLGCYKSISEERMDAPIHHLCQRLDVRIVGIASDLIGLTGDVDFYRTLHSRGDNIERYDNVKQAESPERARAGAFLARTRLGTVCPPSDLVPDDG